MVTEPTRRLAFFCATCLEVEMWHVYRQIRAVRRFEPIVITQKRKNARVFPFEDLHVVARSPFRFWGRFLERNITHFPWQMSGEEVSAINGILSRGNAGVLHVFFGNVAIHLLPLLRACPVPVVISFHGADVAEGRMTAPAREALEEVFQRAALVGCRSEALRRDIVALGCPAGKTRILRTIIPQGAYAPPRWPADGAWRFIQACRLIGKKGVDLSLRAFAAFAKTRPNAEFIIAGDGPQRAALLALAEELGIARKVRWPGFLAQPALQAAYRCSHAFLHPSRTTEDGDREGIPNSLLEAMALGLPVIATDHGGISEAVLSGREGFLVPENDVVTLSAALETLTAESARYLEMSHAAYDRIQREFSEKVQAANLEKIYGELVR